MKNKSIIIPSIGALAGLGYAFMTKKSFWGYVGFFALGAITGSLVSNIISGNNASETSAAKPNIKPPVSDQA
jgi:hypothetical protein